jgi:hypothetical protein
MDREAINRIKTTHRPAVHWLGCAVKWACTCGAQHYPCSVLLLALEIEHATSATAARLASQ